MTDKVYSLQGLNDYLGDAISDDEIGASQIADSIKKELTELATYHEDAARKCRRVLSQLGNVDTDRYDALNFFPNTPDYLNFSSNIRQVSPPDTITL